MEFSNCLPHQKMSKKSIYRKNKKLLGAGFRMFAADEEPSSSSRSNSEKANRPETNETSSEWFEDDHEADDYQMDVDFESALDDRDQVDPIFEKELLGMKRVLNLDGLNDEIGDDSFDPSELLETDVDRFLFGYLKLIIQDGVIYSHMDNVLKLLKETLLPSINTSHATIINKFAAKHLAYDYQIKCDCGNLIFLKKRDTSKETQCDKCRVRIKFREFTKQHDQTCVFSMREQINQISKVTNKIKNLPKSRDEPLEIEALFTLDGAPLSDSSKEEFYPNILYIDNFESKYLMDKYPIYKTATLFTRRTDKNSYDQIIAPLLDELNSIPPEGFETNWSKRTTIRIKMIIGDAKVRAVIMNFLQHNGRFPCHRCYIEYDPKFLFPCLPSDQLELRKTEDIPSCIDELKKLRAGAKTKTQKKELTNYKGVKGPSLLADLELDLVNCVILDVMHLAFLGVCRLFLSQFYEDAFRTVETKAKQSKRVRNPYYLDPECKEVLNNRLSELKTPSSISRPFRSFDDLANFKAKEFENFLFFGSYFTMLDVLQQPYFGHLMLLNSAIHKVYSKTASSDDVEKAKFEIDLFVKSLDALEYGDAFYKYNTHCLPHLYEDRVNFGQPLSRYNAYGYEGELQFDKSSNKSKNKSVEAIANKVGLRSIFKMYSSEQAEEVLEKDRVYLAANALPLTTIMKLLKMRSSDGLRFYQKARIYKKLVRIRGSNKVEDSFVKIGDQFYQVTLIFKKEGETMVLCEKIPNRGPVNCSFGNYSFTLNHIKVIDQAGWKERSNFVFKLREIRNHFMYVRMDGVLPERYCVDLEV